MKRPTFWFMSTSDEEELEEAEFTFGESGLLRRLEVACHLTQPHVQVLSAIGLTWAPIVLFGAYSELVRGQYEPILHDIAIHVRLLVATPIFLVLDFVFPRVCRTVLAQVSKQSFVPEEDRARYHAMWRRVGRLADSNIPELLIGIPCLAFGFAVLLGFLRVASVPNPEHITATQGWYAMTDLPLFQFLLWRSLWRWLLWIRILVALSRFPLDLIATHADRRGGISFLRVPSIGYCATLLFAISSVVIAEWGKHFVGEAPVESLKPLLALFGVAAMTVAFGPLLTYTPLLFRARYRGLLEASAYASQYARKFRVRRKELEKQELDLSHDLQGLAALNATYRETVEEMKLYLFYKKDVIVLLAATLAPVVPLALWAVPQEEWKELGAALLGTTMP